MESLKRDAGKLAIWNLIGPIGYIAFGVFLMSLFSQLKPGDGIRGFVGLSAVAEVILFLFFFKYWYRFLSGIKRCYPDNGKLDNAVILGRVAVSIRLVTCAIALLMVVIPVFFKSSFSVSTLFTLNGIVMSNDYAVYSSYSLMAFYFLLALMFLFFMQAAEKKSDMQTWALICMIMYGVSGVLSNILKSGPRFLLELLTGVAVLLFLRQIRKGCKFAES